MMHYIDPLTRCASVRRFVQCGLRLSRAGESEKKPELTGILSVSHVCNLTDIESNLRKRSCRPKWFGGIKY